MRLQPSLLDRIHCASQPFTRQNSEGQVVGATVRDTLSGKQHTVYARTIVNAAGPFSDEVRALSQVRRWMCTCCCMLRMLCIATNDTALSALAPTPSVVLPCLAPANSTKMPMPSSCMSRICRMLSKVWCLAPLPCLQPNNAKMIMPSSGVHVTLPDYYSPENGALGCCMQQSMCVVAGRLNAASHRSLLP